MKLVGIGALLLVAILWGCNTQRTICPAYQSAFVFDKTTEKNSFFIYNESQKLPKEILASNKKTLTLPPRDSNWDKSIVVKGPVLPIERRVKKNRYLLLQHKTYRQAVKALQTVPMKPVYPAKKTLVDSDDAIKKALDSAARTITDTLTVKARPKRKEEPVDSSYVISLEKEKFNLDQDNYMWYLRDNIVLPDVKLALSKDKNDSEKKKGFFDKLLNLFKKKKIEIPKNDSTPSVSSFENVSNLPDSTGNIPSAKPKVDETLSLKKKKKGLFGNLFKKKPARTDDALSPNIKEVPVRSKRKKRKDAKKEEDDGL